MSEREIEDLLINSQNVINSLLHERRKLNDEIEGLNTVIDCFQKVLCEHDRVDKKEIDCMSEKVKNGWYSADTELRNYLRKAIN